MQLLEHFKELTIHPKNTKELTGLILQLAIQGKLTKKWRDEHPNLEPASVLLEKIKAKKHQLIKENKINKEKILSIIKGDDTPFEIPKNWSWIRLGDYIHNFGQKKPDVKFEYIDVASIDNDKGIIKNDLNLIDAKDAPSRARKIVKKGCVLYSTVRPYLLNIAVVNREFQNEAIASTAFSVLNPLLDCSEQYLYHILRSNFFIEYVERCMKGVAYPAINDGNLLNAIIPIAPLEEQKAIVDIVERLFKEVEQLEAQTKHRTQLKEDFVSSALRTLSTQPTEQAWASLMPHFKEFFTEKSTVKKLRETVLQLAVQGKLTKKWRIENPDVEPASVLLEKIKAEKEQLIKAKKIKNEKPLPTITEDEIPYELPEGWEWARFQEVYDVRDGTHDSPKDSQNKLAYPLITSMNFKNGMIDFESARRISKEDYEKVIKRSKVDKGDVLFSMIGGNIGNQVIVGDFTEFAIKNVALFKHYKYGLPEPGFINIYSKYIAMNLQNQAVGGAQPFVSLKFFRNLVLGLPSIEEQKAIVEKVNALMAFCDQLEEAIAESTTQIEQLMQSCLKEVFEG